MSSPLSLRIPKAVLFDHDGVLVQSESLHWKAWRETLRELGIPYVEAEIGAMVGSTAPQIMATVLDKYRPGWDPQVFDVNQLAQAKNNRYLVSAQTELQLYPGVKEMLAWLKVAGIRSAVVSNARKRELEQALNWVGIFGEFDLVISRDDAGVPKPDPTPYLMAAASLGFEVSECLAVEDSPTGIEAALVGRVPAAAVLTNFPRHAMETPVPGRPDLKPVWVGESIVKLLSDLRNLA